VFACPSCCKKWQADERDAGRRTKCGSCGAVYVIPGAIQARAPAVPPPVSVTAPGLPAAVPGHPALGAAPSPPVSSRHARPALSDARKVIFFGLVGALGCLAGWVAGEPFLYVGLPAGTDARGSLATKPQLPQLTKGNAPPAPAPPALPTVGTVGHVPI